MNKLSACKVHNIRFFNLEVRSVHCMSFEPNRRRLALSRIDNSIEIWDLNYNPYIERTIPSTENDSIEALKWFGCRLFSCGLNARLIEYNLKSLSRLHEVPVIAGAAWCLDINTLKKKIAIGTEDGFINIFNISDDGLEYVKVLNKQEGRILCLAWNNSGEIIVTGSENAVRIWNVQSGFAFHRMTTGRSTNKPTIVWCVAIMSDSTVISGDSRGRLTFWNSEQGTEIESLETHKADILCLALSEDENKIFCAGVDPVIVEYNKVPKVSHSIRRINWVKSLERRIHNHDVRCLVVIGEKLISCGVDGYLVVSSFPPKIVSKYPPLPQFICSVSKDTRCVLFQNQKHLELWKLGLLNVGNSILEETKGLKKLVTIETKLKETIICSSLSNNGRFVAYSTISRIRLFEVLNQENSPLLKKFDCSNCEPALKVIFSENCDLFVIASVTGNIYVYEIKQLQLFNLHIIHPYNEKILDDNILFLNISPCNTFLIASDCSSRIVIWTLSDGKFYSALPNYKCSPTAVSVSRDSLSLMVAYADNRVIEYSLEKQRLTKFSSILNSAISIQWVSKFIIKNIVFDERQKGLFIFHDDNVILVARKNINFLPKKKKKISHLDNIEQTEVSCNSIKTYQHIAFMSWIRDNEMLIVEINPKSILENLPPLFKTKVFGCG